MTLLIWIYLLMLIPGFKNNILSKELMASSNEVLESHLLKASHYK